jgi:hypothetical protein
MAERCIIAQKNLTFIFLAKTAEVCIIRYILFQNEHIRIARGPSNIDTTSATEFKTWSKGQRHGEDMLET